MDSVAVRVWRGNVVESVHRAHVAVVDASGRRVASFGDPSRVAFLRSAAKPFQAIPLIETGAADTFGFTPQEIAIATGSHGGEPRHVRTVRGMLTKLGLTRASLGCGRHAPYDAASARRVGPRFTALHHNCSGKHAGMLALALHLGQRARDYLDPRGPALRAILQAVASECGVPAPKVGVGVDGCGATNFAVPLHAGARAFARLASADPSTKGRPATLARIRGAMQRHPEMVAGRARLDTDVARVTRGRVLVKAGAEACYGASLIDAGHGMVVKVEDGNARGMGPLMVSLLRQRSALPVPVPARLARHATVDVTNVAGRVVGRLEAVAGLR